MAKSSRKPSTAYLDTKGTLLQYFDELRDGRKVGASVDIHYQYCKLWMAPVEDRHTMYGTPGRIIFPRYGNSALVRLSKGGRWECRPGSIENGSENTKRLGIRVQFAELRLAGKGNETLSWHEFPGAMSCDIEMQLGEQYLTRSDARAGMYLDDCERSLVLHVTGKHPDAEKTEVA